VNLGPSPQTGVRRLFFVLIALVVAGIPAVLIGQQLLSDSGGGEEPKEPSFRLEKVPPFRVRAGSTKTLTLGIRRDNFPKSVRLTFDGVPARVRLTDTDVPADTDLVPVDISVDLNAVPGKYPVTVHARAGELHQKATFQLTVDKPKYVWNKNWERPPDTEVVVDFDKLKLITKIDVVRIVDGKRIAIRFLLVKRVRREDPPSFYMMENKVSFEQFRSFAEANPKEVEKSDWKKPALAGKEDAKDNQPVMRTMVLDAYRFARWLGGDLPSREQWEKAAGWHEPNRRDGPFRGKWDPKNPKAKEWIAVGRALLGPLPCGQAKRDISPSDCRDMSGNGWEWTRDLDDGVVRKLLTKPTATAFVHLRGQSWTAEKPLIFEEFDDTNGDELHVHRWTGTWPDVGFRVVIDHWADSE
jgi:hypothetical protein